MLKTQNRPKRRVRYKCISCVRELITVELSVQYREIQFILKINLENAVTNF